MNWFREKLRKNRVIFLTVLAVNVFYMLEGVRVVEARQIRRHEEERQLQELSAVFGIPIEKLRGDGESLFKPIKKRLGEVGSAVEAGFGRLQEIVRRRKDRAVSHRSPAAAPARELSFSPQAQIAAAFPQEKPRSTQDAGTERVSRAPRSLDRPPSSLGDPGEMILPIRRVEKKVRTEKASAAPRPSAGSSSQAPPSVPRQVIPKNGIAPEIVALAESLGNSPAGIFRLVHDNVDFDPKWGVHRPPLGTLREGKGTAWDQAWLLQELLTAAGVDARFQWGEIEIPTAKLLNLTGVEDPWQAGNLLTTAGVPIVLVVQGSQVLSARMSHAWIKAHLDYIPNRGVTPGPGDTWVWMDPSLKRFAIADGFRLDDQVPFVLGEYLESGTPFAPRQVYEEALQAYVADHSLGITLEEVKRSKTVIQEAFPFVPGTLRGKILTVEGESVEVPAAFQQQLELQVREAGGNVLATWSTPWPAVYGQRLEVAWPGATAADQATLDLYGGVFVTPPYEVDLKPVIRVDGVEVAAGGAIGSAEDIELMATLTPPQGSATVVQFEMLAGEHAVFAVDFGQTPQEVIDRISQELSAATDPAEEEAWTLALAGALYQRLLGGDLDHLAGLRWQRLVQLGTAVLAVHRGAVSTAPDGTPLVFSQGPMSLDLGAMPLGLFPAAGAAGSSVPTLELLGSQGSFLEAEALSEVIGGEQITAVTFLTRAVREGQTLTLVDAGNVDAALAQAELSAEAEAHVRAGVARGKIAWIAESQLPVDTFDATGYILEDPATGAAGYFVTIERLVEGMTALIEFHSPQDLEVVTAPIDVVATIESEALESWTLSYQFAGEGQPVVLATGTGSVTNATLAQFDPTLLLNGLYDIVLTGRDIVGQSVSGKVSVVVEGDIKIGNFTLTFTDLAVPLSGLDIEVIRTYDSRDKQERDFGVGWTLDIRQGSYRNNRPPGDGWKIVGGLLPCQGVQELKSHLTVIRLSDNESYRFRLNLFDFAPTLGGCFAKARLDFVEGKLPGSTLAIIGNDSVFYSNDSGRVLDTETFEVFEPASVRLTTRDGRIFNLDIDIGVTRLEDLNGNAITITPTEISHSSGLGIQFERDGENRITSIVDPAGNAISYEYDQKGDLVTTINQEGHATRFTYHQDHLLADLEDPLGVRAVRNDYDADGRLIRVTDAFGKATNFEHDLEGRREVVTDRLGHVHIVEYDQFGNVVGERDPLGNHRTRTYDERGNMLSITDPLGNVVSFAYSDQNDLTAITDTLGTTAFTYNPLGQIEKITDRVGNSISQTFDTKGNRLQVVDELGEVTSWTYDDRGNVLSQADARGNVMSFGYDGRGNLTSEIDPFGNETTFTYDVSGNLLTKVKTRTTSDGPQTLVTSSVFDKLNRPTSLTKADGSKVITEYDAVGNVKATTDELGRRTTVSRDAYGRPVQTTYPDGTTDARSYDTEGRKATYTHRDGSTTSYGYDAIGRLLSFTAPDGTSSANEFDAMGRIVAAVDNRGNRVSHVYDAAGRATREVDALSNVTEYAYDANGNLLSETDPLGNTMSYEYDAGGRMVRKIFPDGTEQTFEYDNVEANFHTDRWTSMTDRSGRTTVYENDAFGRLVAVTDALGRVTRFEYDEVGWLIAQTDANGRTTRFEYDNMGRKTKVTLPDGSTAAMTYDGRGKLTSRTDFSGRTVTYVYDLGDHLVEKRYPDGTIVNYTYTAGARRSSVTDSRGQTTYTYHDSGRLASITYPTGETLTYEYDGNGNRTSIGATFAGTTLTTSYVYDSLNRVSSVEDPWGRFYTRAYDPNGNLLLRTFPNGVETRYTYDTMSRVTSLTTTNTAGEILQSYTYGLAQDGKRTSVSEADGTVRTYSYNLVDQLTNARVERGGLLVSETAFTYNNVGNRLSETRLEEGGTVVSIASGYDDRDRLIQQGDELLSWDLNGNVTAVSGSNSATYEWDFDGRLKTASRGDGSVVRNVYDTEGHRVQRFVEIPGSATAVEHHLVDTSTPLTQVVLKTDAEDRLLSYFVRGDRLLASVRTSETRFLHSDGLGTTRVLTNGSGEVVDQYTYSPFGRLVEHVGEDTNEFLFAGEELDPIHQLYYLRARWMDPRRGIFTSMDPFDGFPGEPLSLQRYMYAFADPVNMVDPLGFYGGPGPGYIIMRLFYYFHVQEPLVGRLDFPLQIRPVVLEDLKMPWTDAEVEELLQNGKEIFMGKALINLEWEDRGILRLLNFDPYVDPWLDTETHAAHALSKIWAQAPGFLPVIFTSGFDFKATAYGITPFAYPEYSFRGSFITKHGLKHHPDLVVAHELVHSIGLVKDKFCAGAFGYLMGSGPCGYSGDKLFFWEVSMVRKNSLGLH